MKIKRETTVIKRFPEYGLRIEEDKFESGVVAYSIVDDMGAVQWVKSYDPIPEDAEYQHTYEEVWIVIGSMIQCVDKALDALDL